MCNNYIYVQIVFNVLSPLFFSSASNKIFKENSDANSLVIRVENDERSVIVDGKTWFELGPVWFNVNNATCSNKNGCLTEKGSKKYEGKDKIGQYEILVTVYEASSGELFEAIVKTYRDLPVAIMGQVKYSSWQF